MPAQLGRWIRSSPVRVQQRTQTRVSHELRRSVRENFARPVLQIRCRRQKGGPSRLGCSRLAQGFGAGGHGAGIDGEPVGFVGRSLNFLVDAAGDDRAGAEEAPVGVIGAGESSGADDRMLGFGVVGEDSQLGSAVGFFACEQGEFRNGDLRGGHGDFRDADVGVLAIGAHGATAKLDGNGRVFGLFHERAAVGEQALMDAQNDVIFIDTVEVFRFDENGSAADGGPVDAIERVIDGAGDEQLLEAGARGIGALDRGAAARGANEASDQGANREFCEQVGPAHNFLADFALTVRPIVARITSAVAESRLLRAFE